MKKILVVRLSALGDIIHGMPVISDIRRRWPEAIIDIAVDERFVDIPLHHGGIRRVIGIPLKRFKKNPLKRGALTALRATIRTLRSEHYDVVIDLHGLWKSALVARLARTRMRVGFHVSLCAEKPAARFYHQQFLPARLSSRVQLQRDLVAFAVDSDSGQAPDYGLRRVQTAAVRGALVVVFFHSASREDRCWAEANWTELGHSFVARGWQIELPWGSAVEQQRSHRIQQALGDSVCVVPPLRGMGAWIDHFADVALVIGVDSGMTHLAAATGVACLGIFTASCPELLVPQLPHLSGTVGRNGMPPSVAEVILACDALIDSCATVPGR